MGFLSDISGAIGGLFKRLPISGGTRKKEKSLSDVPKVGFQGSRAHGDIRAVGPTMTARPHTEAPVFTDNAIPDLPSEPEPQFLSGDSLENYTDLTADDIDRRMKLIDSAFTTTYGFNPPESLYLTVATNPGIKDGAIPTLFSKTVGSMFDFAKTAARPWVEGPVGGALMMAKNRAGLEEDIERAGFGEISEPGAVAGNLGMVGLDIAAGGAAKGLFGKAGQTVVKGVGAGATVVSTADLVNQYSRGELGAEDTAQVLITGLGAAYFANEGAQWLARKASPELRGAITRKLAEETGSAKLVPGGKTKTRGLAKTLEEDAVAREIAVDFGELPDYTARNMKQAATKALSLIKGNPKLANKIIAGEVQPPKGLFVGDVFSAMKVRALKNADGDTLLALSKSKSNEIATTLGQEVKAFDAGINDPVRTIRKIRAVRELKARKRAWKPLTEEKLNKLGIDVTPDEAKAIAKLTNKLNEAEAAIGEGNDIAYGRAKVALANFTDDLKNPENKMGLIEQARGISLAQAIKHPIETLSSIGGFAKATKAAADNSALLRQGWKTLFTHNKQWRKNAVKSFSDIIKTFGGQKVMDEVNAEIISRPNALNGLQERAKLAVGVVEEDFPTSLPEKIPGIGKIFKASEQAFTAFLQRQRADIFDKYIDVARKTGVELNDETLLGIGRVVNSLTGRGHLGQTGERVAGTVNNVFFSPRNLKSNIDVLTGHAFDRNVSGFAQKAAATNLLKVASGTAAILATAKAMMPESVDLDSRSANFGKIRIGSSRFDVTGGMGSIAVLASRLLQNSYKSSTTGEIKELGSDEYGSRNRLETIYDFTENKLSPIGSFIKNLLSGEDFTGQDITAEGEIRNLFVPMIIEAGTELDNTPDGANKLLALIGEAHGISVQSYIAPDNPLVKLDKEFQEDMTAKDENGEYLLTSDEKFDARFQWRDEIKSELNRLVTQKNTKAATGWTEFLELLEERNTDLKNADMSPDSDKFNKVLWEEEVEKLMKKHPVFARQYRQIPEKLILR